MSDTDNKSLVIEPEGDMDALTDDAFFGGAIQLLQPRSGYRAGLDAVLLSATVEQTRDQSQDNTQPLRILDVGAGVGTVGLCVASRIANADITLVEKAPELAEIALKNIVRNGFEDRVTIINTDITAPASTDIERGLTPQSFDIVLANPPFHKTGHGTQSPSKIKSAAHAMPESNLDAWIRFITRMCSPSGHITLVHKAAALDQILATMHNRFGAINILPIHPHDAALANRVIVSGTKGSRAEMKISYGLVLHTQDNTYTPEVEAILRDGAPLNFPN